MSLAAKAAKSRSGCRTCKQRRVKCDEVIPTCKQCVSKKLECPGYAPHWKWSTKHEKHPGLPNRKNGAFEKTSAVSKNPTDVVAADDSPILPRESGVRDVNSDVCHTTPASNSQPTQAPDQIEIVVNDEPCPISNTGQDRYLLPKGSGPSSQNPHCHASPTLSLQHSRAADQPLWQPPGTILSNPQVQVEFFTQKICKFLTAFDSDYNQFRKVGTSWLKESLLFFSLCRYITAAFLSSSAVSTSDALVVQNAQTEILHRLRNAVAQLDISKQAKIEEVLMAVIMYGLTTNWDGSNAPSIFHYNAAVRMYCHIYQTFEASTRPSDLQEFFLYSLVYWWMGLAFVTDTAEQCLLEPPVSSPGAFLGRGCMQNDKRIPHPLAGVSPEAQMLLGKVGSLVYEQRIRGREKSFISLSRLQKDSRALQEAQRLEEEVLSMDLPSADEFVDIADPDTPIDDLVNTAEAHRLSALLLLYRVFPDVLEMRLRLDVDTSTHNQLAEERRLLWLTALATHALEILCRNALRSGTRAIEQILLVIIAGELRKPPSSSIVQIYDEGHASMFSSMLTGTSPPTPVTADPLDQFAAICHLSHQDPIYLVPDGPFRDALGLDHVAQARKIVLKRLQSIREILPYKSLEIVEELVLATWETSDHEKYDVFWMDIMIEKDWRILLA